MISLEEFVRRHGTLSKSAFLERVRDPHLVVVSVEEVPAAGFQTVRFSAAEVQSARDDPPQLFRVAKREGANAFGMMITMGRAANNDLVIPNARVSKFHAYFSNLGGTWTIKDANSRNGTFVNDTQVSTESGTPLSSGAKIKLAKTLDVTYYDPEGLFARVQAERG